MTKRPGFKTFKKTALKDKKFKAEYEALWPEFELIRKKFLMPVKRAKVISPVRKCWVLRNEI